VGRLGVVGRIIEGEEVVDDKAWHPEGRWRMMILMMLIVPFLGWFFGTGHPSTIYRLGWPVPKN